jgi:hypothetical protein
MCQRAIPADNDNHRHIAYAKKFNDTHSSTSEESFVLLHFESHWLNIVDFENIFQDYSRLSPIPETQLRYYYPLDTLKRKLTNHETLLDGNTFSPTFWRDVVPMLVQQNGCSCQKQFPDLCSASTDYHVVTGDISQLTYDAVIIDRLNRGSNYREPMQHSMDSNLTISNIESALDDWLQRTESSGLLIPRITFNNWKTAILADTRKRCAYITRNHTQKELNVLLNPSPGNLNYAKTKTEIERLTKDFCFFPADKSRGNLLAICNVYYKMRTASMLCSNPHYQIQPNTIIRHDIIQSQLNFFSTKLDLRHIMLISRTIASFYILLKPQKDPIGARPVCAAHDCISSIPHRIIVRALRCIKSTLRAHDNEIHKNGGPRTNWVIESALEFIIQSPHTLIYAVTADVNDMYHELNQDFLISAVTHQAHRACTIRGCNSFAITVTNTKYGNKNDYGTWANDPTPNTDKRMIIYTIDTILELIKFTLKNCFLHLGDEIFRQKTGIPMGAHSSGDIADIATYSLERDYTLRNPNSPAQFCMWRQIDDVLGLNLPNLPLLLAVIYPKKYGYTFKITHSTATASSPININFLDVTIFSDASSRLHTKLYDKRSSFSFEIQKFPDIYSCVSLKQTLSTFYGELVRYYNIHSRLDDYTTSLIQLFDFIIKSKSYPIQSTRNIIKRFIQELTYITFGPNTKYEISVAEFGIHILSTLDSTM